MADKIVWIAPQQSADRPLIGGKALNLIRLAGSGVAVPPGFILTTQLFEDLVGQDRRNSIQDILKKLPAFPSPPEIEQTSGQIKAALSTLRLDQEFTSIVIAGYQALAERTGQPIPTVAVRSSGTGEDDLFSSGAGIYDSFLGVRGVQALIERIWACWLSVVNTRALLYWVKRGSPETTRMAVIVQEMVPAEASGVMMTINPVNRDRSKMVIEAVWGLGEPLVRGEVNPDRFLIDKLEAFVISANIAHKPTRLVSERSGENSLITETTPPALQDAACLTQEALEQLISLGRRLETAFEVPLDIEFATCKGQVYILQARAETSWAKGEPRVHGLSNQPIEQIVKTMLEMGKNKR